MSNFGDRARKNDNILATTEGKKLWYFIGSNHTFPVTWRDHMIKTQDFLSGNNLQAMYSFTSRVRFVIACVGWCAASALVTTDLVAGTITGTHGFQIVRRLTGPQGSNSINPTWQVGIGGTDLGHMVNHSGKTYFLFGDTFASEASAGSGGPDWRNNVMAYSTDLNPSDGITFDGWITRPNGTAKQVITPGTQSVTYIPTGAISVGDKIYAWYMHVSDWSDWSLSHSGLSWWREGDSQFTVVPNFRFENPQGGDYSWGHGTEGGNFGMVAASYRSPLENSGDPFIYMWGTPGGREGGVKLARVLPSQIENLAAYRFFNGTFAGVPLWTTNEHTAVEIVPSGVGEMSVMYNEALSAWTMMSVSGGGQPDFEIRQAPNPWGPWSDPIIVADFSDAPGLYSPYMNPLYVEDGGRTLYFTMSLWNPYDVYLAKVTLDIAQSGDFDRDGDVDGRDFLIWQRGESPSPLSAADLAEWRSHYGTNLPLSGSTAVPEPSCLLQAILAMVVCVVRRCSEC